MGYGGKLLLRGFCVRRLGILLLGMGITFKNFILAKTDPSRGNFTIYSGGFLRAPPGFQIDAETSSTDDQKSAKPEKLAGLMDKGHFLTLIVGKGLNSKDSSKF